LIASRHLKKEFEKTIYQVILKENFCLAHPNHKRTEVKTRTEGEVLGTMRIGEEDEVGLPAMTKEPNPRVHNSASTKEKGKTDQI
jgi:hypothetical protein